MRETELCPDCRFAVTHCYCSKIPVPANVGPVFFLLYHEQEPQRLSNTGVLIEHLLPETYSAIWQRREPDQQLLSLLARDDLQPWLIFPADRPELSARAKPFSPAISKRPLFILPDGTWKEVRKMVRRSPYLDSVPILAFNPDQTTRYTLRRNPDADHLCTAEIAEAVLRINSENEAADRLSDLFDLFMQHYHAWQHHLPAS
mgnify:CR=1 FL=1